MRIRSIKPEFWRSDDVTNLPWSDRLLFIGLWSYVDDNGVGRDVEKLVVADLFPMEENPRETLATVSRGLQNLADSGLVDRYMVDGRPFLHIASWDAHQRIDKPNKARYPLPTCDNAVPRETLATVSRQSREIPAPGAGEQWNRGTEEQSSSSPIADAIDDPPRLDVERICDTLADRIEANGSKRPTTTKAWRDAARLIVDRDGHTEAQAVWLINWATTDAFWKSNILSLPKFREKFDQLRLASQRTGHATDRQAEILRSEMTRAQAADAAAAERLEIGA